VMLRYWEKWTGVEGDSIQAVVDSFNQSQDRSWVVRTPVSDIAAKAMVAISGGDAPDVVGLYSYNVPMFAESKAAMAMDEFTPGRSGARIDPEAYIPAVHELLSHGGRQWAGVNTCYALALYYNRGLFREVGMDPERPPRTVEELDEASRKLTVIDGKGAIERAGFLQNLPAWWPYFWPILFGGKLFDPKTQRALLDEPAAAAAYSWVQSYPRRLGPERSAAFGNSYGRNFHSPDDPFISGKVAMIVQGPWLANFINVHGKRRADGTPALDYFAAPAPVASAIYDPARPVGMIEADVLMIPRGCPHPEEAFEFLAYTQRRDVQERLATMHAKSSPMRESTPGFLANHPNPAVRVHDAVMKSPRAVVLPQTRAWQQMADLTNGAFDSIWKGADVRATLAGMQARAQDLVDRSESLRRRREESSGPAGFEGVRRGAWGCGRAPWPPRRRPGARGPTRRRGVDGGEGVSRAETAGAPARSRGVIWPAGCFGSALGSWGCCSSWRGRRC